MNIIKQIASRGLIYVLAVAILGSGLLMSSDTTTVSAETLSKVYLTNKGHLYKLDSKNPKTLGQKTEYITRIEEKNDFTSIAKTAYGEDIKQYFTSTTKSGDIYFSEDLKDWNKLILKTLKD